MTSRRAFGEALRAEREQRGITLETISHLTKISTGLLAALEQGDCSRWPGGIYSRAYIRDYAQAIGLDRDETAERFARCFAETAFPEGVLDPRPRVAAAAPPAAALRLMLDEDPHERHRVLAGRARAVALDLFLVVALAALLQVATGAGFWIALAGVSLCCRAAAVFHGGSHAWDLVAKAGARRQPASADSPATDPALAEAA